LAPDGSTGLVHSRKALQKPQAKKYKGKNRGREKSDIAMAEGLNKWKNK
jgi:hypothetical protein